MLPNSAPFTQSTFLLPAVVARQALRPAEVLRGCRHRELELGTAWPAQAQTTQPEDPLEMCKQHLIEKFVGSTNPYRTDITKNLALVYQDEGRPEEAEQP